MDAMDPDAATVRRREDRSVAGAAGALLAAGALAVTAGPLGVTVGVALLGAWAVFSVPYVLALGHLGLAVLFPDGPTLQALALVESGFLLVLGGPFLRRGADLRVAVAPFVAAAVLFGAVAAGLRWLDSTAAAALVLAIVAGLLAYGLHRYELVRLGLVEA